MKKQMGVSIPRTGSKAASITMVVLSLLCSAQAHALTGPGAFAYEGRVLDANNNPVTHSNVSFVLQVVTPDGTCVLREETTSAYDLSTTNGYFAVSVGTGTRSGFDPGLGTNAVFTNGTTPLNGKKVGDGTICSYTPAVNDARQLRVTVNDGGTLTVLSPNVTIGATPYAMVADSLQGYQPTDFLLPNATANLTQTNLESIFSSTNFSDLTNLIAGTSSKYAKSTTAQATTGTSIVSGVGAPTSPANGSIWIDTTGSGSLVFRSGGTNTVLSSGGGGGITSGGNSLGGSMALGTNDANILQLKTNGVTQMTVDTSGRVGIGTTSPTAKLAVNGSMVLMGATSGYSGFIAAPAAGSTVWTLPTADGTSGQVLSTNGSGQLGWTTASGGSGDFKADGTVSMTGNFKSANGTAAAPGLTFVGGTDTGFAQLASSSIGFVSGGSERMRLTAAGNFGVGTTSPLYLLDVAGNIHGTSGFGIGTNPDATASANTMSFKAGIVSGNSPQSLYVENTQATGTTYGAYISRTGASTSGTGLYVNSANASSNYAAIFMGGNVGIGTTTPGAPLDVKGSIRMSGSTSGYGGFQVAPVAGSTVWTLPTADGSNGQVLTTNGAGGLSWTTASGGGSGITGLTGDVTASGSGSVAATVVSVGGSTASAVNAATVLANSAASANNNNAIVRRDATGNFVANVPTVNGLALNNSSSIVTITNPIGAAYSISLPTSLGATGQVLTTNGSGSTSWTNAGDMKSDGTVAMNGTFQANNGVGSNPGTAGTPAYGFLAYPGMGMYVASGPGLAMSTNSIERLRIDSAGNVGIGTTPAVRLDVASNTIGTTGTAVAKFSNTVNPTAAATGTYPGLIGYAMTSSSFMGSAAIVGGVFQAAVTGNTASEVRGADAMAQNMSSSNLSTMRGLNAVTSNTGTGTVTNSYGVYTVANNPGSSGPVTNSYGVYIDTPVNATNRYGLYQADTTGINYFGGKVGIGITSPSNLLEVATASATGYTASSASSSLPSNANQGITLRNTSTAAATYVIHPFMVNAGATQQSAYLGVVGSGGYTPAVVFGQQTGASSYSESMRIDSTGQLGIGTVTPQARLDVAGSARIQGQINSGSQTGTTANIDWNLGNSITTSYNCGSAFSFANLRDGGSYTLVATDTGTNTCTFNTTTTGLDAGTVTYKFKVANSSRASLSYTVYKLNRVGAFVFVDWAAFNY